MTRLIRAEFLKLRTTQVWFWLLVGAIALSALVAVVSIAPSNGIRQPSQTPELFSNLVVQTPGWVFAFVLGVLCVTTEFRYQTITPTVLQTTSRWLIVSAKLITSAIVGAVYAIAALLTLVVIGLPWLSAKGVDIELGGNDVPHALWSVFLVITFYGVIGMGVGALLRNQIVAVVVGIVFLLILQNLVLLIPGVKHIWAFLPEGGLRAIVQSGSSEDFNGVTLLSTTGGVIVLLVWAIVPAVIGAAFSMNRDIT